MAQSVFQKKRRDRHKTLGTNHRIRNPAQGGLVATRYRFASTLARISVIRASLAAFPFDIFFGLASHIMLERFMYIRPPVKNDRLFSGEASCFKGPTNDSLMLEAISSIPLA